jgi:hypothetical protein
MQMNLSLIFTGKMENAPIQIPKAHLIMALCLPLAILLGYLLAQPLETQTIAVIVMIMAVLSVPLLMSWYHPLLILSWNAVIFPFFIPGHPAAWMLMSALGIVFAVLNRAVNKNLRFIIVPSINTAIIFLLGVVFFTAFMRGGMGMRILGGDRYGGRNYVHLLLAMVGYFVFTSQKIAQKHAYLYVFLFFASSLSGMISNLASFGGPAFYFLFSMFPPDSSLEMSDSVISQSLGIHRIGWAGQAAICFGSYMLARFGLRGLFDFTRPWRALGFLLVVIGSLISGFRSNLILLLLVMGCYFVIEGLHRTRYLTILLGILTLSGFILIPFSDRLPLGVQRTLSFLPLKLDPMVKLDAEGSTEWRIEMWKAVLPSVPRYLILGKGYGLDASDLYMSIESTYRLGEASAASQVAGDYHNGPLTLIIPLGIWGVLGFVWFGAASLRTLYFYCKFGASELRTINNLLLASFAAKIIFFLFVFGSFSNDLYGFVGIIGLAVSLNGAPKRRTEMEPEVISENLAQAYGHA